MSVIPSSASTPPKRRRVIDLQTKINIIEYYEAGQSLTSIARAYGMAVSTINSIVKDSARIKDHVKSSSSLRSTVITRQRSGLIYEMERKLMIWMAEQLQLSVPLTLLSIRQKARSLFECLKTEKGDSQSNFSASPRWFNRFKARANFHYSKLCGESTQGKRLGFQETHIPRSQEERIVAGAQQKQSLQEYEDRSSNLYEDQQQIPEVLEVESKQLLEVPLITLTHTHEDDFENRITGEVQSSGMAPQTSEFRLPETVTLQRVTRKSDSIRITDDMQSSEMAPQTSEFRRPETLPMPRLARKLDIMRQGTTSEPGPSTQNSSVTIICAPELSTMKSSSQSSETSEDPLALLSDPTYEPNTVRPRRFQNASKSVSLTLPKPHSTRNEVTIEYFGGDSESNVNATKEYEEQQRDGRDIEKVLLQLRAEKLLLEIEKLKQERLKMEAEKRNIKLRNEILSLRLDLARPQDTVSSSDHSTTTRITRESSSKSLSLQCEPSQNPASSVTTKQVPLEEESLRISCVPQQSSSSNIKSSWCQNSSPDVVSAKCETYKRVAHPSTSAEEGTSRKINEMKQLSSERAKENNYKASSMPVETSNEELTRKTRIDYSESEQVSLSAPYLKEEEEEHFTTEQALFYSAVHGQRDLERDATRHSTLLVGSLNRSGLSDSSIHESDSVLEVESMCRSRY